LTNDDIRNIAHTYHAWRGDTGAGEYSDVGGFCNSVSVEEIGAHGNVLTPGRYVGTEDVEDQDERFEEKMTLLVRELEEQFAASAELEAAIRSKLRKLFYEK
jgi:type I restriction enzyme M protein